MGIAAPAGPFERGKFLKGVQALRKAGFVVTYGRDIFSRSNYLAGDDRRRSRELNRLLQDKTIEALIMARGGYGCMRLLPLLQKKKMVPKVLVGFSDVTVLHHAIWKRFRLPTLYGPMVATGMNRPENLKRLRAALTDPDFFRKQRLTGRQLLKGGTARGRLVGGCLCLIAATLGTPYELETDDTILFLEDTMEEPYAVDRMITQFIQAGKLRKVRGIVFGTFELKGNYFPESIRRMLKERLHHFRGPVLWGVPFGHHPTPKLIPHGGIGRIQGRELVIEKGIF